MTIDKWIVLIVAVCLIIALNVNFIRRMNRRERETRDVSSERRDDKKE